MDNEQWTMKKWSMEKGQRTNTKVKHKGQAQSTNTTDKEHLTKNKRQRAMDNGQ